MEIIELLFASSQFCGCVFDIVVLLVDVWTGVSTVRHVKANKQELDDSHRPERTFWLILLVGTAFALTVLMGVKWFRHFASH